MQSAEFLFQPETTTVLVATSRHIMAIMELSTARIQNQNVAADSYYFQPIRPLFRHSFRFSLYPTCLDLDFGSSCLLDSTPRLPRLVGGRVAGARADKQLVAVIGGGTEALVLTAAGEVASAKQSNQNNQSAK